jgi:phage baseplate assembly protein W
MADTPIFYKDLSLDMIPHPVTGDIRPITNETAIRRSLLNTLQTRKGERAFFSEFGTSLEKYLFEPANALTENLINKEVYDVVTRFEPRVTVTSIESKVEDHGIDIKVNYYIKSTTIQDSVEFSVTRA